MQIKNLFVYPIKSLRGVEVASVELEPRGLAMDRRWMLVDEMGVFITQRLLPLLALFQVSIFTNELRVLNRTNQLFVSVPFDPHGQTIPVQVWDDQVEAKEVSLSISQWFSNQLNKKVSLVFMPESSMRQVNPTYAPSPNDMVSFADGYPILIANTASLTDLNSRLKNKVYMSRFRPNIVVDASQPFEEDDWKLLKTQHTEMALVKKCARCVMVNINPETAEKGTEVLAELSQYRKLNHKVYFGVNAIPLRMGNLSVGDVITIT